MMRGDVGWSSNSAALNGVNGALGSVSFEICARSSIFPPTKPGSPRSVPVCALRPFPVLPDIAISVAPVDGRYTDQGDRLRANQAQILNEELMRGGNDIGFTANDGGVRQIWLPCSL